IGAVWLEQHTQPLAEFVGLPHFPGLGVLVGLVIIYVLGVLATSLVGGFLARRAGRLLVRIPRVYLLFLRWKRVLLLPAGKRGIYHRVVLVPSRDGRGTQVAFTSGETLPGDPPQWCVFVPSLPNPLSGQLVFFPCENCRPLDVSVEDAFKLLLSTG